MILVTVGTTKFPFLRLMEAIDIALKKLDIQEELVVQSGKSSYIFGYSHTKKYTEISFSKLVSLIRKARVVISHGGAGSVLLILEHNKHKPLIVPRSSFFGEHIDSHQIDFVRYAVQKGLVQAAFPEENIVLAIKNYIRHPIQSTYYSNPNKTNLIHNLRLYTKSLS